MKKPINSSMGMSVVEGFGAFVEDISALDRFTSPSADPGLDCNVSTSSSQAVTPSIAPDIVSRSADASRTREDKSTFSFPPLRLPSERMQNAHEHPCIQLVLVVLAYVNVRYGVSHRACDFLLRCLRVIFIMAGLIVATSNFPTKLQTVQHRLQLTDRFKNLITCPECKRIHPECSTYDSQPACSACGALLWDVPAIARYTTMLGRSNPLPTPKLTTPYRPLKDAFRDLFTSCPELISLCMSWQDVPSQDGVYTRVMDGRIWREIRRKDGSLFFDQNERDSLRVGVFINMDW
jgi:hypothetical protein